MHAASTCFVPTPGCWLRVAPEQCDLPPSHPPAQGGAAPGGGMPDMPDMGGAAPRSTGPTVEEVE